MQSNHDVSQCKRASAVLERPAHLHALRRLCRARAAARPAAAAALGLGGGGHCAAWHAAAAAALPAREVLHRHSPKDLRA